MALSNADFTRFSITSPGNYLPIAELIRDEKNNAWTVTVTEPGMIDHRIIRIFAGFVTLDFMKNSPRRIPAAQTAGPIQGFYAQPPPMFPPLKIQTLFVLLGNASKISDRLTILSHGLFSFIHSKMGLDTIKPQYFF